MTTAIDPELRIKIDTAGRMEEEITKLYNEKVAKKRHQITRLYMPENIMNTLVAQPMIGAVSSQLTLIIKVSGTVNFQENYTKPFQKTFTVTAQGDKWKIASDCSAASGCWMLSFKGIDQYMDAFEGDIP
ncbi:AAEL009223-PA [Aedes aegypti]|uniref:AAEL009223-PA n=1 Tax=Aedes aegypti TaxID=7159 RepID=Q16WH0_AEDAE|nr:AAEL009223-PA [Aedes aegypti]